MEWQDAPLGVIPPMEWKDPPYLAEVAYDLEAARVKLEWARDHEPSLAGSVADTVESYEMALVRAKASAYDDMCCALAEYRDDLAADARATALVEERKRRRQSESEGGTMPPIPAKKSRIVVHEGRYKNVGGTVLGHDGDVLIVKKTANGDIFHVHGELCVAEE